MVTKAPTLFVGYYRVSTQKQGRSGLGLEAQRTAVGDYVQGQAGRLDREFTEVESGKRNDRPELEKALAHARRAATDTQMTLSPKTKKAPTEGAFSITAAIEVRWWSQGESNP